MPSCRSATPTGHRSRTTTERIAGVLGKLPLLVTCGPFEVAPTLRHMSLSAAEFYEAGMSLPPAVRKDVALRLLESLEVVDQETVDEAWTAEVSSRVDEIVSGRAELIPGEQVFAELAARTPRRT